VRTAIGLTMPVDLSRCLTVWVDAAGVDPKELRREFESGDYEQLQLRISRTANVPDLEFLDQIDGIRELDILGPVKDDTYAFRRTDVRSLLLLTRCRRRIPDTDLRHLEKLAIDNRPNYEQIHDLPHLKWLAVFGWRSASFSFLGDMPSLEYFRIEARKALISLAGLERCPNLREIWLAAVRVDSLEALRHLQLRSCGFSATTA
jgi:hypothetical protein